MGTRPVQKLLAIFVVCISISAQAEDEDTQYVPDKPSWYAAPDVESEYAVDTFSTETSLISEAHIASVELTQIRELLFVIACMMAAGMGMVGASITFRNIRP